MFLTYTVIGINLNYWTVHQVPVLWSLSNAKLFFLLIACLDLVHVLQNSVKKIPVRYFMSV